MRRATGLARSAPTSVPISTTLASRFQKKDIVESILWPSKTISDQYDVTMIETTDGHTVSGFVVREEGDKLVMRTADTMGRQFEVAKAKVKKRTRSPVSMMPEGLVDELSQQQIQGLILFLQCAAASGWAFGQSTLISNVEG